VRKETEEMGKRGNGETEKKEEVIDALDFLLLVFFPPFYPFSLFASYPHLQNLFFLHFPVCIKFVHNGNSSSKIEL
jgi:hypothetical protein